MITTMQFATDMMDTVEDSVFGTNPPLEETCWPNFCCHSHNHQNKNKGDRPSKKKKKRSILSVPHYTMFRKSSFLKKLPPPSSSPLKAASDIMAEDDDDDLPADQKFLDTIKHPTLMHFDTNTSTNAAAIAAAQGPDGTDWCVLEKMKSDGCCSASLGELRKVRDQGGDPLESFHTFLWTDVLPEYTECCGVEFDRYELPPTWCMAHQDTNVTKGDGSGGYDTVNRRFDQILQDTKLPDSQRVLLVFHGSAERNIKNILENGLDPSRRSGQAYGQGEYFAIDPAISTGYCRDGSKSMVVFAVIVPPDDEQGRNGQTRGWFPSVCVIKETKHQFPLGVMSFKSVSSAAQSQADMMRAAITKAQKEFDQKAEETKNAEWKALIIQLLIQAKVDLAARKYEQAQDRLSETYKKEIAMYAHEAMDPDIVPVLFPDLPPPFKREEFEEKTLGENAEIKKVEDHAMETQKAKAKLDQTKNSYTQGKSKKTKQGSPHRASNHPNQLPVVLPGSGSVLSATAAAPAPPSVATLPETMKTSAAGTAVASLAGKFLDANPFFCEVAKSTMQDLKHKNIYSLIDPVDLDVIAEILSSPLVGSATTEQKSLTWNLRGNFEDRSDIGLSVILIRDERHCNVAKCFAVTLIKNPTSKRAASQPIPVPKSA